MSCPCEKPVEFPKEKVCGENTPPVIQIDSKECPILFHTMVISAAEGDINSIPPTIGAHKNLRVYYEANRTSYLYDSDGVPQVLSGMVTSEVHSVNGRTGEVTLGAEDVGVNARIINGGETAPTTATVGVIGTLYTCVTEGTGHLYICTGVDDTTYTWQEITPGL